MTNQTSTLRLRAGVSAILAFIAMVIALGLAITGGFDEQAVERGAVDLILSNMEANATVLVISMWGFVVLNILISVFGIELYRLLANGRSGLLFAPVALLGASGLFIMESLLTIGVIQGLAPVYATATGPEQTVIQATTLALLEFRNHTALLAGVLIAIAAIIYGREMLLSVDLPDWLGYGGLVVGVFGIIGAFYPLFAPLSFVRVLEQLLALLWILLTGIHLLRIR